MGPPRPGGPLPPGHQPALLGARPRLNRRQHQPPWSSSGRRWPTAAFNVGVGPVHAATSRDDEPVGLALCAKAAAHQSDILFFPLSGGTSTPQQLGGWVAAGAKAYKVPCAGVWRQRDPGAGCPTTPAGDPCRPQTLTLSTEPNGDGLSFNGELRPCPCGLLPRRGCALVWLRTTPGGVEVQRRDPGGGPQASTGPTQSGTGS